MVGRLLEDLVGRLEALLELLGLVQVQQLSEETLLLRCKRFLWRHVGEGN